MRRLWPFALLLLVAPLATADPLARRLPADTLAHLVLDDGRAVLEGLGQIEIGALLKHPDVTPLIDDIFSNVTGDMRAFERRLGMTWAEIFSLFQGEVTLTLTGLSKAKNPIGEHFLFSAETGDQAATWRKLRALVIRKLKQADPKTKYDSYMRGAHRVVTYTAGDANLATAVAHGRFWAATDHAALHRLLDGAAVEQPLADLPLYKQLKASTTRGRHGLFLYVNAGKIYQTVFGGLIAPNDDAVKALGLDQIQGVGVSSCLTSRGFVETIQVHAPGATRGVFSLLASLPKADPELLRRVPEKTVFCHTASVDPLESWMAYLALVRDAAPKDYDKLYEGLHQFEKSLGMPLATALKPLGKRATLYLTMPDHEGLTPDIVLLWELKDAERARDVHDKLIARLTRQGDDEPPLDIRRIPFRGDHFHYVNLSRLGGQQVIAPAFALRGKWLVLAQTPINLKEAWVRLEDGHRSLADTPRFRKARRDLSDGWGALGYLDAGRGLVGVYETMGPLLQALIPKGDVPFEPGLLPRPAVLAKHVGGVCWAFYGGQNGPRLELSSPVGIVPFIIFAGGLDALTKAAKAPDKGLTAYGQQPKAAATVSYQFRATRLSEALDTLARQADVAIRFPRTQCDRMTVTAEGKALTLERALAQLLPKDQLKHRIRRLPGGAVQVVVYPTGGGAR